MLTIGGHAATKPGISVSWILRGRSVSLSAITVPFYTQRMPSLCCRQPSFFSLHW